MKKLATCVTAWLTVGLLTTAVATRRHSDWLTDCCNHEPSVFLACYATVFWPITVFALIVAETLPHRDAA